MSMCRLGICLGDDGIIMIRANVKRFRDLKSICEGGGARIEFDVRRRWKVFDSLSLYLFSKNKRKSKKENGRKKKK